MSAERRSSSVYEIENNLFLDILDEAPLFGFAVLAVGVTWIFHPIQELDFQLLCSCNVALLVITGIFQQYLVYQVQKIRLQGYCVFSQKLKHIIRLPFATIAYGTAAMLLVMVWDPDISILSISTLLSLGDPVQGLKSNQSGYEISKGSIDPGKRIGQSYQLGPKSLGLHFPIMSQGLSVVAGNLLGDMQDKHRHKLSKLPRIIPFHKIIMLAEVVCAASFMTLYIGYVHQYNSFHSQPDVLKSLYSPLQPSSSLEGLRYQDGGRLSDQLMTLLQYQQENIHFLNEEILGLQESLSKYERSNDGSAPQVDLAHLLAARDQELRTLSAEMNQLQSELRLARSLIEEKDAEMQRIRSTNNQYVEENERLRAILGEWSSRAAKLERALELERMSNLELQKKVNSLKSRRHD